ncbi:type II secretion system F family protein [Pontibacillus yanchengensis]|uniref:Type II secretion system protein F n=1 Tax=Pontibacillus yanchengensis Y32 TaxID=1385514 RepID=A0A0A2TXA9_9BACI|nr:type II secretion system F family protein [Pontibacillus yanchengensis]KGP73880.1 type II secretion system protein F [Pontibacillus yanchengensis Y32]
MAYYRYKARNKKGLHKEGKLKAESKRDAIEQLKVDGLSVISIKELNSILYKEIQIGNAVKSKDFVIYLRQFSTLIESGVSIVQSTSILAQQSTNKALKSALNDIFKRLESGQPFSDSAEQHSKIFPPLFINMVRAGEAGGNIDEVLDQMAEYYEKQNETRQKVISALTYPCIVLFIAVGIIIFLLSSVVPQFKQMFESMGGELPVITKFIFTLGQLTQSVWWLLILIPLILILTLNYIKQVDTIAYRMDFLKLKIPIFGSLIQKAALVRMTRTLSSLFHSSVPILDSVRITERVVENKIIEKVLIQSRSELEKGESMAKPFESHWIFPPLVTQMIALGEQTGSLDKMLKKIADFYEQELDHTTDRLKTLLEPVMITFLAVIVGTIVASIAIPMFSIFEQIQ